MSCPKCARVSVAGVPSEGRLKPQPMTHRSSPLLLLIVLSLGLFLRTVVPVGWMPASDGTFAIEPCPAADAPIFDHATAHDDAGMHHGHGRAAQHDGDCAFAPLAAAVASPDLPEAAPSMVRPEHVAYVEPVLKPFATGPPAPPPPATGPPPIA
jgi:hypothetical protein